LKLQGFLRIRLQKYNDKFEILLANNGEEAITILEQSNISLLVTDIQMPKVDGLALLAYMNDKHPDIPCIVLTAYLTNEIKKGLSEDSVRFFQKPFQFDELADGILQALDQDVPSGALKGISVASFLQMIELEQKTCLLEVQAPGKEKGLFYFQEGLPHDALYGNLKGEAAAFEIIAMDRAKIRFRNLPKKKYAKRINKELMGLIMEATRRKEESPE